MRIFLSCSLWWAKLPRCLTRSLDSAWPRHPSHLAKDLSKVLIALFWDFMGSDKAKYHVTETPQQMFISLAMVLVCKNWKEIIRKLNFFKPIGCSCWFAINSESFFFFFFSCSLSEFLPVYTLPGLRSLQPWA